jgi:hypothetical protein
VEALWQGDHLEFGMATTAKAEEQEAPASEAPDAPLLDLSDRRFTA